MRWLDFCARTGKIGEYVQEGEHIILGNAGALVLYPGLFAAVGSDGKPLDDEAWSVWAEHPEIKRRISDGSLRLVSEDLREYAAPGDLLNLISRTSDRAALDHIRDLEDNKPRGYGEGRQNADVISLLDRANRLARSPISTQGLDAYTGSKAQQRAGGKAR